MSINKASSTVHSKKGNNNSAQKEKMKFEFSIFKSANSKFINNHNNTSTLENTFA